MSVIAGIQDFRQEGPPADIGTFQIPASAMVFQYVFSGTTYICAVRSGDRGWVLIDYGTVANTVIQAAIDGLTVGIVFVKAGTYYFSGPVSIAKDGVALIGEGMGMTIFSLNDGVNDNVINIVGDADRIWFVTLADFRIYGNRANNTTGHGIYMTQLIADSRISNVVVIHCAENGIYANGDANVFSDSIIENVYPEHNNGYGIYLQYSHENTISAVYPHDNNYGIRLDTSHANTIEFIHSGDNTISGLLMFRCYRNTVSDSEFHNEGFYGINLTESEKISLEDVICQLSGRHGFILLGTIHSSYIGCKAIDSSQDTNNVYSGFYLGSSGGVHCVNNIFLGCHAISEVANRQRHGFQEADANQDYNIYQHNIIIGSVTSPAWILGIHAKLATKTFQFQHGGSVEGTVSVAEFISATASAKGWRVDGGVDWAVALGQLPSEVQQIVRIKIWAVALGGPIGSPGQMHLEIVMNAGADNLAFNTEPVALANFDSVTTDYVANDVIYWSCDSGDDADIGSMVGGMSIEIKVIYEAGSDPDGATNAVFRVAEIEYV